MSVFSSTRTFIAPKVTLPPRLKINKRLKMDGLKFLSKIPSDTIPVSFFDPQYRGVYEKMAYGNEHTSRNYKRVEIPQMSDVVITKFVTDISRILMPSGHLFLWLDKFHLCTNFREWFENAPLEAVDLITWNKKKIGLGYRARHTSEFLLVLQKLPKRAKGAWTVRNIPDVWDEKVPVQKKYNHTKPVELQSKLIEAVSNENDLVVDPAAGSFSVKEACVITNRTFLGCDISG
jgi:site-specific DNA-methyltransferase (adenine-specific)